jgi:adenylate cyclase
MTAQWQLRVYDRQRLIHSADVNGPVELGRQSEGEEGPFAQRRDGTTSRVVIARLDEDAVSRKHLLVEPLTDGRVRLSNLSRKRPVRLSDGSEVAPGATAELPLPAVVELGRKTVRLQPIDIDRPPLRALTQATLPPCPNPPPSARPAALLSANDGMEVEQLFCWLQAAMGVLQSAASPAEFFPRAARAVVDLVGLDSGRVLLHDHGEWRVQAVQLAPWVQDLPGWRPSRYVLDRLLQEKRTYWLTPGPALDGGRSLAGMDALVAAPILNAHGEVIGALYGDRHSIPGAGGLGPITKLEAMLVELLATGVAAGLARVEHEQAALRARVQFEQFFTPELSRQLAAQPDLLRGRDSEITVLFCDIRGFSRSAERLGPARTVEWVGDVMGALSECVLHHGGVLVDYIGDELMAMWGAPQEQPDQAGRACSAALDMLGQLPLLNERWAPVLGAPMGLGIGVNTGLARVGNTGTQRKFKYGPLGSTVNLASRVQGATKYLRAPLLVTRGTHTQLGEGFASRRVCQARVVNIAEAVELYEVAAPGLPGWAGLCTLYEEALTRFERHDFAQAMRLLFKLLNEHPDDGPALALMSRAIGQREEDLDDFDPVWELPGK